MMGAGENWIAARKMELQGWTLSAIIKRRDELGVKMDPRVSHSLVDAIAEEEARRLVSDPAPVPGVFLEETEGDTPSKYELHEPQREDLLEGLRTAVRGHGAPFDTTDAEEAMERHINLNMGAPVQVKGIDTGYNRIVLNVDPRLMKTQSADFIVNEILPMVLRHFLSKNADYGDQHRTGLGVRAEFVGMHRKFAKLKSYFWDNKPMNHENGREMLYDLVGAILLMLDLIEQEEAAGNALD